MKCAALVVIFSIVGFMPGLHAEEEATPVAFPGDWEVGTPASAGIDWQTLEAVSGRAAEGEFGQLHSLLIVRGGRLVFERYYRGADMFQLHTIQSVSKSVASALIGIAIGEGAIKSVEQPVSEFFPEHRAMFDADPRKRELKLKDVLTMTFGNDWDESAYPYSNPSNVVWAMALSDDWMGFILGRAMVEDPGTRFNYNSGAALLLSGLLQNTTGMQAHVYAEQRLFYPLGIGVYGWYRNTSNPQHWSHTGGGLNLRSRDLAKIGYLYVNHGMWAGKQIIPASWVEQSTKAWMQVDPALWYGYQWWLQRLPAGSDAPDARNVVIEGRGWGGQYLFAIPSLDLVVVTTSGSFDDEKQARRGITLVLEKIVPAVKATTEPASLGDVGGLALDLIEN